MKSVPGEEEVPSGLYDDCRVLMQFDGRETDEVRGDPPSGGDEE